MSGIGAEKWGPLGSLVAVACCFGGGALLAVFAPLGLAFLVTDFVFVPLAIFFLAATLWGLQRSRRRHGLRGPLATAAVGSVLALGGLWIWWPIVVIGIGLVHSAAVWNLALRRHLRANHEASASRASRASSSAARHLIVVGGGSAAFAAAIRATEMGASVTIVNGGLPVGGTCVNVGCVPSKTLLRAAEAYHRARKPGFDGVASRADVESFSSIIGQKNELVGRLRKSKYEDLVSDLPGVRLVQGRARLVSTTSVAVGDETIEGDRLLIATGVRPSIPPIPGLAESGYLTNETAFELEELPESLIVLGGRYVALETAQIFARLGTRVTIVQRSNSILPDEETDLTDALSDFLRREGIEIVTGATVSAVRRRDGTVQVDASSRRGNQTLEATHLLAALGRTPNTSNMGLEEVGVALTSKGFIEVDSRLQTSVAGIAAAGDVIGDPMFVYTAAYEGALAASNLLAEEAVDRDYTALPWVVFTDPQIAGVGLDERQAGAAGIDSESATLPLSEVPRALAARDTRGFIRLIRDKRTDRLIGARVLAPEGSELLMEISLAIKYGITAAQIASSFHPYLTLSEGVKLAAITFGKDVSKLSCCAA